MENGESLHSRETPVPEYVLQEFVDEQNDYITGKADFLGEDSSGVELPVFRGGIDVAQSKKESPTLQELRYRQECISEFVTYFQSKDFAITMVSTEDLSGLEREVPRDEVTAVVNYFGARTLILKNSFREQNIANPHVKNSPTQIEMNASAEFTKDLMAYLERSGFPHPSS